MVSLRFGMCRAKSQLPTLARTHQGQSRAFHSLLWPKFVPLFSCPSAVSLSFGGLGVRISSKFKPSCSLPRREVRAAKELLLDRGVHLSHVGGENLGNCPIGFSPDPFTRSFRPSSLISSGHLPCRLRSTGRCRDGASGRHGTKLLSIILDLVLFKNYKSEYMLGRPRRGYISV